ncbi:type VII secretion protein EssC [Streptococcus gallolyticus subsp. gallolyticus]|uniref:type VII secretion protein EssC n=1 Tax=Streptococcus gallolyticus TaxID=315405 RepID=UPI0007E37A1B|nr:type VII secretion protein EssC [Streptococcus gallolyticus]OAV82253.1 type VII secretion protein EssC [Streptococcus gallolyticus subsp. gallolyticus]OCW49893.1 type VII secretion protein EssC [Streptococcus gallolyticus subsp. gallolyticus]
MIQNDNMTYYHHLGDYLGEEITSKAFLVCLSDKLSYMQFSDDVPLSFEGVRYSLQNGDIFRNGDKLEGHKIQDNQVDYYLLKPKTDIFTLYFYPPYTDFVLSSMDTADIHLDGETIVLFSQNRLFIDYDANSVVYVNGVRISDNLSVSFNVGDSVFIEDYLIERRRHQWRVMRFYDKPKFTRPDKILLQAPVSDFPSDFPDYHRSPRVIPTIYSDAIKLDSPMEPASMGRNSLLRAIVPPLGMFAITALTGLVSRRNPWMMLGMGGFSLLTAGMTMTQYFQDKKYYKKQELIRVEDYDSYLLKQISQISHYHNEERDILNYNQPNIDTLSKMVFDYDSRIYERMNYNADFLQVSLGTGDIETNLNLQTSFKEQSKDEQAIFAKKIVEKYKMQHDVPITLSLSQATLGIIGTYDTTRPAIFNLLIQLAVFHSYQDINFVILVPEESYANDWYQWRFLPHLKLQERNVRGIVHDARSRDAVLNALYQIIQKRMQLKREMGSKDVRFAPHYIITVFDDSYLVGHSLNEYLAEDLTELGVTVIWIKEAQRFLPETVTTLVEYQNQNVGQIINDNGEYLAQRFIPYPESKDYELVARTLANLNHVEIEKNSIPKSVTFLELYKVQKVDELRLGDRWAKADTSKTLAVPLGLRGKEDIVELNLHERAHGPHGLVAGTTGSGKSEILQSYMLSLAVNFGPEDVGFLPIDFKGGGMANLFKGLPHLMGVITNLDGAASARALASIKAELQKRQRFFEAFGVNHINGYTKLYKQGKTATDGGHYPTKPLPHLFLISDEFAELKANEPEFMTELVSAARIGRSLGVHLILATQKPSGVVDDQIWSNSRFKLALKVSDKSDSNEIIKTPDAASIVEPGRAYLQVGNNEIYELFQSAWSGATYQPNKSDKEEEVDDRIWLINDLGQYELLTDNLALEEELSVQSEKNQTELEALVDYISSYAQSTEVNIPDKPWLPPLKEKITSPVLTVSWSDERKLAVPFAMMDVPSEQSQRNFDFDVEELSHTVIYGSPGFGKSVALQTLIMNFARLNTPEQVQFNLFDFGTNGLLPLKDLPHVVDLTRLDEEEKLLKFLKRIDSELKRRKDLFAEYSVATLAQYEQKTGEKLPVVFTIVDGFDAIKDSPMEETIEASLNRILREGSSLGCYLIITALRVNSLKISMSSNVSTKMALFLVEDNAVKDIIGRNALIQQEIFGRGQVRDDVPYEIQIYLPSKGEEDIERLRYLEEEVATIDKMWTGQRPKAIPMLPNELDWDDFYGNSYTIRMLNQMQLPLAFDKESTDVVGFIPEEHGYFVIMDDTPTQTRLLESIIVQNMTYFQGQAQRIIFDSDQRFEGAIESFDLIATEETYNTVMNDLLGELNSRSPENPNQPIFVYMPDAQGINDKMMMSNSTLDTILKKAAKVGIYFIFQVHQKTLETRFDEFSKRLRSNIPAGMFGTRFADQNIIKGRTRYGEPLLEEDEAHFFVGRDVYRVKIAKE